MTRTLGAAIGAIIFVLFMSDIATRLAPGFASQHRPVVIVSQR